MSQKMMNEDVDFVLEDEQLNLGDEQLIEEEEASILELDEIDFEALGINPEDPTQAKPGSEEKVLMLSARYAAGLPLWHNNDRYDHAPGQSTVSGFGGLKFDA